MSLPLVIAANLTLAAAAIGAIIAFALTAMRREG